MDVFLILGRVEPGPLLVNMYITMSLSYNFILPSFVRVSKQNPTVLYIDDITVRD